MAFSIRQLNPFLKTNNDTGFGSSVGNTGGRFVNKDGSFNVKREGIPLIHRYGVYQYMLHLPLGLFILFIFIAFFVLNMVFTVLYATIGAHQLSGLTATTEWGRVKELFYFSAQTLTTVGYGRINPVGDAANLLAACEAITGFLCFALATGLIYGRFAMPKSFLTFSTHALISPYGDGFALMFRMATVKEKHVLSNVDIKVNLALTVDNNGKTEFKFYELDLERNKLDNLPMNLTVVHPITENSPLYGMTEEDLTNADTELYVLVTGYDDIFSNTVLKRTSYTYSEIVYNAKFVPMYRVSKDGNTTIVELQKLSEYKVL